MIDFVFLQPAIQSSVVATPTPSRLKRDVITKTDDKTKSRFVFILVVRFL